MSDSSLVEGLSFRVHHTMLPVADLDRSIAFYTRLLGMTVGDRHKNEARGTDVGTARLWRKGLDTIPRIDPEHERGRAGSGAGDEQPRGYRLQRPHRPVLHSGA